jgi:addiction module RelE/StbE family toxin
MRLILTDPAVDDLEAIVAYISSDNPAAAQKVAMAIAATAMRLCDFPEMGHAGHLPGTREFPVPGSPYVIVYQVARNAVIIIVFYGARNLVRALAERRKGIKG